MCFVWWQDTILSSASGKLLQTRGGVLCVWIDEWGSNTHDGSESIGREDVLPRIDRKGIIYGALGKTLDVPNDVFGWVQAVTSRGKVARQSFRLGLHLGDERVCRRGACDSLIPKNGQVYVSKICTPMGAAEDHAIASRVRRTRCPARSISIRGRAACN